MIFTVKSTMTVPVEILKGKLLINAKFYIDNYPMRVSETLLENVIRKDYKISLKTACRYLLLNADIYKNNEGNLIILFKNPYWDKLARLITYGNGKVPGCKILQTAFSSC